MNSQSIESQPIEGKIKSARSGAIISTETVFILQKYWTFITYSGPSAKSCEFTPFSLKSPNLVIFAKFQPNAKME